MFQLNELNDRPSEPAPETPDATDIVADAYNEVMSDPVIRTSHDAAKYILDALEAAGHRPSRRRPTSFDFKGQHELDWDEIELALHAIRTIAVKVEMVGRCAVDSVHAERLDAVFDSVRVDLETQADHLWAHLGFPAKEVSL